MIFLTADLHFGHERCATEWRGFGSAAEMDDALVRNWNGTVGADDTVFVLGDFAMGRIAETLPIARQLTGRKILVPGNHDRCWAGHRKVGDWPDRYREVGFEIAPLQAQIRMGRHGLMVCHFPYRPSGDGSPAPGKSASNDRYFEYRPKYLGYPLAHGHVHGAWKTKGRMVNVGVDVWDWAPVPLNTVTELLRETLFDERTGTQNIA